MPLVCGDNLAVMRQLPEAGFDLLYADPPFFSERTLTGRTPQASFADGWNGDLDTYLGWLVPRLREMHRLLRPTGCLYVHLDWHAAHYVKVELDRIFGRSNFLNEIIWVYKTGGVGRRWWGRKHDTLLLYARDARSNYVFNSQRERSYLRHRYGFSNVRDRIQQDEMGYFTEVACRDVWEIPALRPNRPESLGYPTQKPEALIERIVLASSNAGSVVGDFFCGSGTTLSVAHRHHRRWFGCDSSQVAIDMSAERLRKLGAEIEVIVEK